MFKLMTEIVTEDAMNGVIKESFYTELLDILEYCEEELGGNISKVYSEINQIDPAYTTRLLKREWEELQK